VGIVALSHEQFHFPNLNLTRADRLEMHRTKRGEQKLYTLVNTENVRSSFEIYMLYILENINK